MITKFAGTIATGIIYGATCVIHSVKPYFPLSYVKKYHTNTPFSPSSSRSRVSGLLYAFYTSEGLYKVGKTVNLKRRTCTYKSTNLKGFVYYTVQSQDIDASERILHNILKLGDHHVEKEVFDIEGEKLKKYMDFVVALEEWFIKNDKKGKMGGKIDEIVRFFEKNN